MKDIHTLTYLTNQHTFNLLGKMKLSITIKENPYNLKMENLFGLAARKNKKRGFLFVSKALGKHLPVNPYYSLLCGALLSARYTETVLKKQFPLKEQVIEAFRSKENMKECYHDLIEKPVPLSKQSLFIGFAETATALGHSMFEHFTNSSYIHTTREELVDFSSTIHFKEEHSHAISQCCYGKEEYFSTTDPIVLIDDEITTGKTTLNIIESIQTKFPRKEYTIVSILDWRSAEDEKRYKEMEQKYNIKIHSVSLVKGLLTVEGEPVEEEPKYKYPSSDQQKVHIIDHTNEAVKQLKNYHSITYKNSINSLKAVNPAPYLEVTGRFGVSDKVNKAVRTELNILGNYLKEKRQSAQSLCLGTGEFMYVPMRIASFMGENILFQSTTRSPIHRVNEPEYAIKSGFSFESPEDPNILHYFYNIPFEEYEEVFLFLERDGVETEHLIECLKQTGVSYIHIIKLSESGEHVHENEFKNI
ncbi:phosphoribosyltransferase family protein [Bacillus taeanensis]|uniref:Adenine/guanine phosphoribosyltransferase n=1 Tax=Bacillus taeanensis TaxID=273032 RepID=A0A366Y473_9BACI|nr:phosphoribosyltransferase family protein [Bacillus taeanensis]RBW70991.1 adenine/guanine phosphoribosyltransferase [Bacillus taeanensis]